MPRRPRFAAFLPVSLALTFVGTTPALAAPSPEAEVEGDAAASAEAAEEAPESDSSVVPEPAAAPEPEAGAVEPEPAAIEPAPEATSPEPTSEVPTTTVADSSGHPREVAEPREPTDFREVPLSTITPQRGRDADRSLRMDKARAWRNAGITGLVVGTGLTISGVLMFRSDPTNPELGNSGFADARDRAGYAIMAPGLLIAAGGVAMLTVGLVQERRLMVSPTASREGAGLTLSGRF